MLKPTDRQLENLMYLRDVTIPWMEAHPARVNFDCVMTDCGTLGCLYGWYGMMRYGADWRRKALHDFGPNNPIVTHPQLFGSGPRGTLADRKRYLDELIAERLAALESA